MAILSSNGMKIDPLHLRTLIRWSDNVDIAKKELSHWALLLHSIQRL